jgi:hypothetical protein
VFLAIPEAGKTKVKGSISGGDILGILSNSRRQKSESKYTIQEEEEKGPN